MTTIIMLAELTGLETAGIIGGLVFGGAGSLVAVITLFKQTDTQVSPQPLNVEIVKELHDQFAQKEEFEAHVAGRRNGRRNCCASSSGWNETRGWRWARRSPRSTAIASGPWKS